MNYLNRLLAAACFVILSVAPSFAASRLFISEYSSVAYINNFLEQIAQETSRDQVVDFSGGVTSSTAFQTGTTYVRLLCDTQCSVQFGASPTATTSTKLLPALVPEYFAISAGQSLKVSVIANP